MLQTFHISYSDFQKTMWPRGVYQVVTWNTSMKPLLIRDKDHVAHGGIPSIPFVVLFIFYSESVFTKTLLYCDLNTENGGWTVLFVSFC